MTWLLIKIVESFEKSMPTDVGEWMGVSIGGEGSSAGNYGSGKITCYMEMKGDIMEVLLDGDTAKEKVELPERE